MDKTQPIIETHTKIENRSKQWKEIHIGNFQLVTGVGEKRRGRGMKPNQWVKPMKCERRKANFFILEASSSVTEVWGINWTLNQTKIILEWRHHQWKRNRLVDNEQKVTCPSPKSNWIRQPWWLKIVTILSLELCHINEYQRLKRQKASQSYRADTIESASC